MPITQITHLVSHVVYKNYIIKNVRSFGDLKISLRVTCVNKVKISKFI